ncbi:RHS repeat-associated core domain-containing protein (plasmid) [Streptomyces sp. HUAS TT11]|uniref:RHS repeat-associated core domain-containing protein n=1 Tax=Streptomyces sp. HUAS TT11 TaxID=3447508 RepID=UPI003F65EB38
MTRRKQPPFGGLRSEQSTAFGTRGFVGGTNDPTGLTHLGAREYDPTLGRFLSVDPVIDHDDPAQMNAYSYAHNSPLTKSDPDGLRPDGPAGGATYNDDRWADDRGMTAGYTKKNGKWVWKQTPKKDKESQKRYRAYRANPSTYKVFYHYNAKAVADVKRKAADEQREKDGILGNLMKGNFGPAWDNTKQWTSNHWDEIKLGITIGGFVACLVVSAGGCNSRGRDRSSRRSPHSLSRSQNASCSHHPHTTARANANTCPGSGAPADRCASRAQRRCARASSGIRAPMSTHGHGCPSPASRSHRPCCAHTRRHRGRYTHARCPSPPRRAVQSGQPNTTGPHSMNPIRHCAHACPLPSRPASAAGPAVQDGCARARHAVGTPHQAATISWAAGLRRTSLSGRPLRRPAPELAHRHHGRRSTASIP